ncbi:MAG: DUF3293 domain-containing protein [Vicinamibacterales bacterium]
MPWSPRPLTEELRQAYAATTFTALVPGGELRLRVGERHPDLDALQSEPGQFAWAYITAHNPGSVPTEPAANERAHRQLIAEVVRRRFQYYEGSGIPDDRAWPPEQSVLILGIAEEEAVAVGARFGQLAIVAGTRGEPARLVAVAPSDRDDDSDPLMSLSRRPTP